MRPFIFVISLLLTVSTRTHAEDLKVGVIVPLSGALSQSGECIQNSILLAQRQFDPENSVEFIFEDDQFLAKNSVVAATNLIKRKGVRALVVYGTPTSLAVAPIAEKFAVPMIALSIHPAVVAGRSYVMKHWVAAERQNELVVQEILKRGYKTVAIVTGINDAMLKLRDLFVSAGVATVVLNEEFDLKETDFRSVTNRIRHLNPDAVYLLLWPPQPAIFSRQLRELRFKGPIFGVHNIEDRQEHLNAHGALDGAWLVSGDNSQADSFNEQYRKVYGIDPLSGGANAFDIATILIRGRNKPLNKWLHSIKEFSGACGTYSATPDNDFDLKAVVKSISGAS